MQILVNALLIKFKKYLTNYIINKSLAVSQNPIFELEIIMIINLNIERKMINNTNQSDSPKIPSPTAESNSPHHSTNEVICEEIPEFSSYQHQLALEIIGKVSSRTYYRHFMKNLTLAFIHSLKKEKKQIKTVYIPLPQMEISTNWSYKDLYLKRNKTIDEEQMMDFVHHCATMIQASFKGYIMRKRHQIAIKKLKKVTQSLLTCFRIWKAKRIYNCRRCYEVRMTYRQVQKQIDVQEDSNQRDAKKIKKLNDYLQFNINMFRQTYERFQENAMWIFEENMKPFPKKMFLQEQPLISREEQVPIQIHETQENRKPKRKRQFQQKKKPTSDIPKYQAIEPTSIEERPIVAKGQYVLNEKEEEVFLQESKVESEKERKEKIIQKKQEERKTGNPNKAIQMQKLKKRQKYDPRKVIQQEKRKKKQKQGKNHEEIKPKHQGEQIKSQRKQSAADNEFISEQQSIPTKQKITIKKKEKQETQIKSEKNEKKPDQWIGVKKRAHRQVSSQNFKSSKEKVKNQFDQNKSPHKYEKEKKVLIKEKRQEIETLKSQYESLKSNQYQSVKNSQKMKEQVREVPEKNLTHKKKEVYRPVEQLEETYQKHYGDRYQNLMPKLGLLSVARGTQHESRIPVIDSDSQHFNSQLNKIFASAKFWQMATRMEKNFKEFLIHQY